MIKILKLTLAFLLICATSSAAQNEGPANTEAEYEAQYQDRIKKERLFNVYIPKNLDDAMLQLDKLIAPESRAVIKNIPQDSVVILLHDRLGQWMIMNWGFYGGSRLSHYLRSAKITYPEDMANFLLIAYHRYLNAQPIQLKELATEFREKRKKEWQNEQKKAKVIEETVRKRPKNEKNGQE